MLTMQTMRRIATDEDPTAIDRAELHQRLVDAVEREGEANVLSRHLWSRTGRPALVLLAGAAGWRLASQAGVPESRVPLAPPALDPDGWLSALAGDLGWVGRQVRHGARVVGCVAVLGDEPCASELLLAAEIAAPFLEARHRRPAPGERVRTLRVARVADELGGRMSLLASSLDHLERGLNPRVQLTRCRRALRRVGALADELLSTCAPGHPAAAEVALAPLVVAAVEGMRERAARGEVALELEVLCAPRVVGCEESIERAITNLIETAIEGTPRGGAIALRLDASDREARVEVRDLLSGTPRSPGLAMKRFGAGSFLSDPGRALEVRFPLPGRLPRRAGEVGLPPQRSSSTAA